VVEGWKQLAARISVPALRLYGPSTDPAYAATLPQDLVAGPVLPKEVGAVLARASVLIMGSIWPENSPLVVLEARAAGCPIVAPDIGGLPELIEIGVDGELYRPGDPKSLATALARVLAQAPCPRPAPNFADHVDAVVRHYQDLLS
jgi:glycosyltransferase involved in cell wall biosynthesis